MRTRPAKTPHGGGTFASIFSLVMVSLVMISLWATGCAGQKMPPPEDAVREYQRAIQAGDAPALSEMLRARDRSALREEDIRRLLTRDKQELIERAKALSEPESVSGQAVFFAQERSIARLELRQGRFWITETGAFPARPQSPEQAAAALSVAIASRDHGRIAALLTEEGRVKFEAFFEGLDDALRDLDQAIVDVRQDRARITLPDGVVILLRREADAWRIEEIE